MRGINLREKSMKIAIIGAGSAVFSLHIIQDTCLTENLRTSTISFMDLNEKLVTAVHGLASRYADELGVNLNFEKTTDRKEALRDADFVINTALIGGRSLERTRSKIEEKHGYYPTGYKQVSVRSLEAIHQMALALDVTKDMEEICPDAWYIQQANPLPECCTIVARETSIKVLGLCHGHLRYLDIANTLELDPKDVTFQAIGFNHNIWLTRFSYKGKNAYPLIEAWIDSEAENYWKNYVPKDEHDIQMSPAAVHQYKMFGLFPIGDTVRDGDWWYHLDLETKKKWFFKKFGGPDSDIGRTFYNERLDNRVKEILQIANDPSVSVTEKYPPKRSREQVIPIIDAIANNKKGKFQVNVLNNGVIKGLPDDVVVEVPAIVDKKGVHPLEVDQLPKKIMLERIYPRWLEMERLIEAFLREDRKMLLYGILDDHRTRSLEQAEAVLEDLLSLPENRNLSERFG